MGLETGFPGERIVVIPHPLQALSSDSPLTGDLYICSMGHMTHAKHHNVERPRGAASFVFLYCVWGRGLITVGNHDFALKANQFVVLPKGVPMKYGAADDDPWSVYWVKFNGEKGKVYAKMMSEPMTVLPSVLTRVEQRIELFEKMYAILCGEITMEKLDFANQILPHFFASFKYKETDSKESEQPSYSEGMVNKVLQYMNDNVERHLTMGEIASFAGLSESYFYRKFVKQMSMSPIDYFIKLKINKAAILLLKTSMSVSQIAAKLGFGSTDYFSRTFKKVLGISATEFRKQDFRL